MGVGAVELIAVHERDRHNSPPHVHHIYKPFFLCEATGDPDSAPDHETDARGWFGLGELPPLSTGRTSRGQIELALAHHERPDLPTEFD